MTTNFAITQLINKVRAQEEAKRKPFPMQALLFLVFRDSKSNLRLPYFQGFKLLVNWLRPIDTSSQFKAQEVIYPLYTYEMQELAQILSVHPSIIQQEFFELYRTYHG